MNSIMPMIIIGTIVGCVILGIIIVIVIIRINLNMNPFVYPAIKLSIDISGRKNPTYSEYIDQWVIDNHNKDFSDMSENIINDWEEKCELIIKSSSWGVGKKREYFREMKKKVNDEMYEQGYEKDYWTETDFLGYRALTDGNYNYIISATL